MVIEVLSNHLIQVDCQEYKRREKVSDCANYMNQAAIDEVVRKHNKDLGEELYKEGQNCCHECAGAPGASLLDDPVMTYFRMMGAENVHRICYKRL